jgi:hypothetical protein
MSLFKYFFILGFLTLNVLLYAEKPASSVSAKTICGIVTDQTTGEGLAGVMVKLSGEDKVVYTDFDGKFSISDLTPGEYTLELEYVSYKRKIIRNVTTGINLENVKLQNQSVLPGGGEKSVA